MPTNVEKVLADLDNELESVIMDLHKNLELKAFHAAVIIRLDNPNNEAEFNSMHNMLCAFIGKYNEFGYRLVDAKIADRDKETP